MSRIDRGHISPFPRPTQGSTRTRERATAPSFDRILKRELEPSKHAEKRMAREGIQLNGEQRERLGRAVDRIAERGGRQSLVLMDDLAAIVNVEHRKIVTVVSGERRQDGLFTDIDSAVLAD